MTTPAPSQFISKQQELFKVLVGNALLNKAALRGTVTLQQSLNVDASRVLPALVNIGPSIVVPGDANGVYFMWLVVGAFRYFTVVAAQIGGDIPVRPIILQSMKVIGQTTVNAVFTDLQQQLPSMLKIFSDKYLDSMNTDSSMRAPYGLFMSALSSYGVICTNPVIRRSIHALYLAFHTPGSSSDLVASTVRAGDSTAVHWWDPAALIVSSASAAPDA